MKYAFLLLVLFSVISPLAAQSLPPLRTVEGTAVVSQNDPAARIEVPSGAVYVGAVRFVLFEAADCEIHLFVEADASKRIKRLYWVQFEAYLPEQPTLLYETSATYSPLEMSSLPFYQRARFGQSSDVPRPGSDADEAYALLKRNGYTLPAETVNVTYKHFFDGMRKELLLLVLEDMSLSGVTFAQLLKDQKLQPAWEPVAEQLKARSSKVFTIHPQAPASK
ncbi:hypothetical protein [Arenimonas sp. GDDSR-1]|uniref:hypothetical protein n=1 Tax=Arenimonas sp. GDDSR-1 TaxID=2950125 RepID=UPI002628E3A5|nr:hypothetical protein [Arenimonas sp. GDDSR-1]